MRIRLLPEIAEGTPGKIVQEIVVNSDEWFCCTGFGSSTVVAAREGDTGETSQE
jgi:hypothetical protein